jgi:hypothetical protein
MLAGYVRRKASFLVLPEKEPSMSIASVGAFQAPSYQPRSEASEGPGADKVNDHDADDVKAAAAPGTGQVLDKTA